MLDNMDKLHNEITYFSMQTFTNRFQFRGKSRQLHFVIRSLCSLFFRDLSEMIKNLVWLI